MRQDTYRAVRVLLKSSVEFKSMLSLVLEEAVKLAGAERGFVLLVDDRAPVGDDELQLNCVLGSPGEDFSARDASDAIRWRSGKLVSPSAAVIPLCVRGRAIGALYLDGCSLAGEGLPLLESFSRLAAAALENTRLLEECGRRLETLQNLDDTDSGLFRWVPSVV